MRHLCVSVCQISTRVALSGSQPKMRGFLACGAYSFELVAAENRLGEIGSKDF